MLHQETTEETQIVKKVLREWKTCDMCQKKIQRTGPYEVLETEISIETGESYGSEGGSTTTTYADLCQECFEGRLIPWLQSQGVTMQTKESDW